MEHDLSILGYCLFFFPSHLRVLHKILHNRISYSGDNDGNGDGDGDGSDDSDGDGDGETI